ncbi:biotin--[acetyl-CoA-carboxylase] ligase [Myxococcota bacterium]|nr:biotin--[acetyl-CoA-carboxylase] ligase [Myxococcota bacterium]
MKTRWVSRCESTNDLALSLADDPDLVGVGADEQTAGRGRLGRVWRSPPGCGLYFSAILRPEFSPQLGAAAPLMAAVAAAEVCEGLGVVPRLKWPNDLLLGTRKLGGVLCQAQLDGASWRVVIGLGLNLRAPQGGFPEALHAVALDAMLGAPPPAPVVAARWLEALFAWSARVRDEGLPPVLAAWRRRGPPLGSPLRREGREGLFGGLSATGGLLLETLIGVEEIHAGDVELVSWGAKE